MRNRMSMSAGRSSAAVVQPSLNIQCTIDTTANILAAFPKQLCDRECHAVCKQQLCWQWTLSCFQSNRGAYRASAAKWFHPDSIAAAGSEDDPHFSKAKRVKLSKASGSSSAGRYTMQFKVPLQLAPVMLGFRLFIVGGANKGAGRYLGPAGSRHFTIPVGLQAGHPLPQGASSTCWLHARSQAYQ